MKTPDQRFAAVFPITETYEGWHMWSNDPVDPGGATWCGMTQRAYDSYRRGIGQPTQTVRRATDDEIRTIARIQYWNPVRGDDLAPGVDLVLFDESFNSGPVQAIRMLQDVLGVGVDGQFGLETLGALRAVTDVPALIVRLCARRVSFWRSLRTFYHFGVGWLRRGDGIQAKALAMFKAA